MSDITYTTNKAGFVLWDGRIMSIHNFYVELVGGDRMAGPNSLYCHTVGWANLHGYGEKWGSLDDREIDDLILRNEICVSSHISAIHYFDILEKSKSK